MPPTPAAGPSGPGSEPATPAPVSAPVVAEAAPGVPARTSTPGTSSPGAAALAVTPPAASTTPAPVPAAGIAPWDDAADAKPGKRDARDTAAPERPREARAAPAATNGVAATPKDDGGPPAWVDEIIPDDAEGGYVSSGPDDGGFIASPDDDDDFETMASPGDRVPTAPAAAPVRRAPASGGKSRQRPRLADMSEANWPELAARLPVTGLAAELARQSEWHGVQGDTVMLRVAVRTLADSASRVRLQTVLCEHFGQSLRLDVLVGATGEATAHAVAQQERAERQRAAEAAVEADPFVRALLSDFGGQVVPGSIRHVDPPAAAAR